MHLENSVYRQCIPKSRGPGSNDLSPIKLSFSFRYSKEHLSWSKYFPIAPFLLTEKNAVLHTLLTCLHNIRCESTSTLRSWAAGVGDLIQPATSINSRKSNAMKARAQVIYFRRQGCMPYRFCFWISFLQKQLHVILDCQFVLLQYSCTITIVTFNALELQCNNFSFQWQNYGGPHGTCCKLKNLAANKIKLLQI